MGVCAASYVRLGSESLQGGGDGLTQAVQRSQAPYEVQAVDANHLSSRETCFKDVQRRPIIWIVEGGNQDRFVEDEKVCITSWKS